MFLCSQIISEEKKKKIHKFINAGTITNVDRTKLYHSLGCTKEVF